MKQRTSRPLYRMEVNPVINVTAACNQRCLFCSRDRGLLPHNAALIEKTIRRFKDFICFEGGEPTLFPDILKWIRRARKEGVRNIILVTNGFSLDDPARAAAYLKAGVTFFNVNLPAHQPAVFDALTQTRGNFGKRVEAVRTLIRVTGGRRVRVTLVATSVIMAGLPQYASFILREFPELLYLEINFPKLMGNCVRRPWLVPALSCSTKPLRAAVKLLEAGGMKVITDGFPLCVMKGFEHCAIDAHALSYNERDSSFLGEKKHCPPCAGCSLAGLCMGPRRDYASRRGWKELRPSLLAPASVTARIKAVFGTREDNK